jgi:hypothetical protein
MFFSRMATNWQKHQRLTIAILAFAVFRIVVERGFGWAPLDWPAALKMASGFAAATVAWAFLKTLWELGTAYHKKLCTFLTALRKFCREYWSSRTAAV